MGCILYELACFKKPFEAPNLPILVKKISTVRIDIKLLINFKKLIFLSASTKIFPISIPKTFHH